MRIIFFLLLMSVSTVLSAEVPAAIRISEALHRETIPSLELKGVLLEEALATVREIWARSHPNDSFPVGLADYELPEDFLRMAKPRITLDLKNVSYIEALQFIGDLSGRRFRERRGTVKLELRRWDEEVWVTQEHAVTPDVLAALGLRASSSGEEVQSSFKSLGVSFGDYSKASLIKNARAILVINRIPEQNQIEGIILLLKKGFRITK